MLSDLPSSASQDQRLSRTDKLTICDDEARLALVLRPAASDLLLDQYDNIFVRGGTWEGNHP